LGNKLSKNFAFGRLCVFKHPASNLLTIFGAPLPHSRSFLSRKKFPYSLFVCPIVLFVMKVSAESTTYDCI
jgi:hypothetical protein